MTNSKVKATYIPDRYFEFWYNKKGRPEYYSILTQLGLKALGYKYI